MSLYIRLVVYSHVFYSISDMFSEGYRFFPESEYPDSAATVGTQCYYSIMFRPILAICWISFTHSKTANIKISYNIFHVHVHYSAWSSVCLNIMETIRNKGSYWYKVESLERKPCVDQTCFCFKFRCSLIYLFLIFTYLLTYIHTYLLTYLLTYSLTYLLTYLIN